MHIIKGFAAMLVTALLTVGGSVLLSLGIFGATTLLSTIGLALAVGVLGFVGYCIIGWIVCQPFGFKGPGWLLTAVFNFVGVFAACWLIASLMPGLILLSTGGMVVYAIANTDVLIFVWGIGMYFGALPRITTLYPPR